MVEVEDVTQALVDLVVEVELVMVEEKQVDQEILPQLLHHKVTMVEMVLHLKELEVVVEQ